MPYDIGMVYNPFEEIKKKYPVINDVLQLHIKCDFIENELRHLLATLCLERNRNHLRNGQGLEDLFKLADEICQKIKKYNE